MMDTHYSAASSRIKRLAVALVSLGIFLPALASAAPRCQDWLEWNFWEAARAVDVKQCLDAGVDPNAAEEDGDTRLHWAARYGHTDAIAVLVHAGADLNKANNVGSTSLHLAAGAGKAPMIRLLMAAGENPAADKDGRVPMDLANGNRAVEDALHGE